MKKILFISGLVLIGLAACVANRPKVPDPELVYALEWVESDAYAEMERMFGEEIDSIDSVYDCDDCTLAFMKWFDNPAKTAGLGFLYQGQDWGHCVAMFNDDSGAYVIEPQTGYGYQFDLNDDESFIRAVNALERLQSKKKINYNSVWIGNLDNFIEMMETEE